MVLQDSFSSSLDPTENTVHDILIHKKAEENKKIPTPATILENQKKLEQRCKLTHCMSQLAIDHKSEEYCNLTHCIRQIIMDKERLANQVTELTHQVSKLTNDLGAATAKRHYWKAQAVAWTRSCDLDRALDYDYSIRATADQFFFDDPLPQRGRQEEEKQQWKRTRALSETHRETALKELERIRSEQSDSSQRRMEGGAAAEAKGVASVDALGKRQREESLNQWETVESMHAPAGTGQESKTTGSEMMASFAEHDEAVVKQTMKSSQVNDQERERGEAKVETIEVKDAVMKPAEIVEFTKAAVQEIREVKDDVMKPAGIVELAKAADQETREVEDAVVKLPERVESLESVVQEMVGTEANTNVIEKEEAPLKHTEKGKAADSKMATVDKGEKLDEPSVFISSATITGRNGPSEIDLLCFPQMVSGVHKWSLVVEEECDDLELGVVRLPTSSENRCPPLKLKNSTLGLQPLAWAYSKDGVAWHDFVAQEGFHAFQKDSKITFVLDLTGDGSLGASVDAEPPVELFSKMKASGATDSIFSPAVTVPWPGKVRFHEFELNPSAR
jgi:hypothetical protein